MPVFLNFRYRSNSDIDSVREILNETLCKRDCQGTTQRDFKEFIEENVKEIVKEIIKETGDTESFKNYFLNATVYKTLKEMF
jgi:CRISPR/Cas system CSM-associated protein Csm2 small subunit